MPPAKRRRITKASKPASPVLSTRSLFPFAKTTKAQIVSVPNVEKRVFGAETKPIRVTPSRPKGTGNSKRKLVEIADCEVNDTPALAPQNRNNNPRGTSKSPSPHHQEQKAVQNDPERLVSTPYQLEATHPRNPTPSAHIQDSHVSTLGDIHELPEALQDLIKLHSSFLTALSLHHAHNGVLTPADLRLLAPSIERLWGRRKVTTDDIRRTLGLLQHKSPAHSISVPDFSKHGLKLSDYGNGKICVEISRDPKLGSSLDKLIDVDDLNALFAQNLHGHWKFWCSTADKENTARTKAAIIAKNDADKETAFSRLSHPPPELVTKFIQHLPMATANVCPSLNKVSPLFAKGQKRLEEFLYSASPTRKKECCEVRAKELHKSNLSFPLTKAVIHRNSAFQRLDEVISVLTHLSTFSTGPPRIERDKGLAAEVLQTSTVRSTSTGIPSISGQHRVSLPLATLVSHLKNSLTSPISREEAEKCIRLLADEAAPDWVNIVTLGGVSAVIINKSARIGVLGWKDRVGM